MQTFTPAELLDNFSYLEDWESRYAYVLDLAKGLPPLPDDQRTDANKVHGCVSHVWLAGGIGDDGTLQFVADSDAMLVKGLLAVVLGVVNGHTPQEVHAMDLDALFKQIGLQDHLSPNRRNGFAAMVSKIKTLANSAS